MAKKKTKKPQRQIISEHILKYGHITRNEAIGLYRITRLAAVIHSIAKITNASFIKEERDGDYVYSLPWPYIEELRAYLALRAVDNRNAPAFIH
ncbi:hypothetical protein H0A36_22145 [Endozoicomonas sp. SM1973]|uniref:Uncharacterized protein n=1 Tax=Spartinivicinus marinus TaxID=2994442 RepID=A0A853IAA1_9GAMM|nr:hypothetical protein [Spartinivicinus marinus]MCX4025650.1 hypothetical protein [Spartinivicinus marinus]NYZ68722.1 hypothetical protein [Spartinivicinus marinus]